MVSFIAQNKNFQKLKMTSLLLDFCYYFQSLILFSDRLDLEKGWHWTFFLEDFASFYTSIPQNTWQIGSRFHLLGFTWGIFSIDLIIKLELGSIYTYNASIIICRMIQIDLLHFRILLTNSIHISQLWSAVE